MRANWGLVLLPPLVLSMILLFGPQIMFLHTITQDFDPTVPAMASLVCVGSLFVLLAVQRLVGLDILSRGSGSG